MTTQRHARDHSTAIHPNRRRRRARSRFGLGLVATAAGGSEAPAAAGGLADAVLEAFDTHRLVGLGEIHGLQTHGHALDMLLSDPRLPGRGRRHRRGVR